MPKQNRIQFFYECAPFHFPNRNQKKGFIIQLFKKEGVSLDALIYVFCSDKALLQMNKQYLNHSYFTDILTFPLSKSGEAVSGEIYISIDRVKENARSFGTTFQDELNRVMIHGALHLCGYKDKTRVEQMKMRDKENEFLKKLQVYLTKAFGQ